MCHAERSSGALVKLPQQILLFNYLHFEFCLNQDVKSNISKLQYAIVADQYVTVQLESIGTPTFHFYEVTFSFFCFSH